MPVWLQVAGAVIGMLLSYFTRYSDANVMDALKDIAYNIGVVLERLNEISLKIDQLMDEIQKLPEIERKLIYSNDIRLLNNDIAGAANRYKTLLAANYGGSDPFFIDQVKQIYNDVSMNRNKLEALSNGGELAFAPLAASVCPLAALLELGLLYRLGKHASKELVATKEEYIAWLSRMLDPAVRNSVAAAAAASQAALQNSENSLRNGLLGPAVTNPNTRQAIFCLEDQIGSHTGWPTYVPVPPGEPIAKVFRYAWFRLYAITLVGETIVDGDPQWSVTSLDPKFDIEAYERIAYTDSWYGPRPPYTIAVTPYDSGDYKGFDGRSWVNRMNFVENLPLWRAFLMAFPEAKRSLIENNEDRKFARFSKDIEMSTQALLHLIKLT